MNSGLESWMVSYAINSFWQIPLLFACGWLTAGMLRPLGPAAEHSLWVVVMLLETILPALSAGSRQWLALLFVPFNHQLRSRPDHVFIVLGPVRDLSSSSFSADAFAFITLLYGVAVAYFAARCAWNCNRLAVLRGQAIHLELAPDARSFWLSCASRTNLHDAAIATSCHVSGPVTIGIRHKLVLLPPDMPSRLAPEDFNTVIAHEFAHMHRSDFAKNLVYELLALPIKYHPFYRLTREFMIESREMICDRMASEITSGTEYARSLLRLASLLLDGAPTRTRHAIGILDAKAFERRIMNLTKTPTHIHGFRRYAIVLVCLGFGVFTCGSALAFSLNLDTPTASPQAGSNKPANVPAGVAAVSKVSGNIPKYPEAAKKAKIQGKVLLKAVIGADGRIEDLKVISGPTELQQTSLDAVKTWTYTPFLVDGKPVPVETTISVTFTAGD